MKKSFLNISDFNNEWNRSVLDMAWKERDAVFVGPIRETTKTETDSHPPAEPERDQKVISR